MLVDLLVVLVSLELQWQQLLPLHANFQKLRMLLLIITTIIVNGD